MGEDYGGVDYEGVGNLEGFEVGVEGMADQDGTRVKELE